MVLKAIGVAAATRVGFTKRFAALHARTAVLPANYVCVLLATDPAVKADGCGGGDHGGGGGGYRSGDCGGGHGGNPGEDGLGRFSRGLGMEGVAGEKVKDLRWLWKCWWLSWCWSKLSWTRL